jgi:hypothetical protein
MSKVKLRAYVHLGENRTHNHLGRVTDRQRRHGLGKIVWHQGDQMSLLKNRPKRGPTQFLSKLMHNLFFGKKYHEFEGYFCHFFQTAQSQQSPIGLKFTPSGHPLLH